MAIAGSLAMVVPNWKYYKHVDHMPAILESLLLTIYNVRNQIPNEYVLQQSLFWYILFNGGSVSSSHEVGVGRGEGRRAGS